MTSRSFIVGSGLDVKMNYKSEEEWRLRPIVHICFRKRQTSSHGRQRTTYLTDSFYDSGRSRGYIPILGIDIRVQASHVNSRWRRPVRVFEAAGNEGVE